MNQHGFSLTEVLIATAISSLLLISASRFLPGLQRAVLLQSGQREVEEEVWQRLFALGKHIIESLCVLSHFCFEFLWRNIDIFDLDLEVLPGG